MTGTTPRSGTTLTDDQRAHVARCLGASGVVVHRDDIAGVESNGLCVRFAYGDAVWVRPATARAIREGLA